jgi:hypothetical protein
MKSLLERKTSYLGVTGFTSPVEVQAAIAAAKGKLGPRLLMIGVLMSQKTMQGKDAKFKNRYPKTEDIARIFPDDATCLNLVHYATNDQETLLGQMSAVTKIAGPHMNGIQLNMAWPDPQVLELYRNIFPNNVIVMAVTSKMFQDVHYDSEALAHRIKEEYFGLVDYVLLDPSGGKGQAFDVTEGLGYLKVLSTIFEPWQIGIAGGIGPKTLNLIEPIIQAFPESNLDAEGQLRTPDDHLDLAYMKSYIQGALNYLQVKA